MRLTVLLAILAFAVAAALFATVWPADALFFSGLGVGISMTLAMTVGLAAPEHVDRWRRGADAERRTMRQLGRLEHHGWAVAHDLADGERANRDHVAVAPSGEVFLLDSKAPGGVVEIKAGVIRVRWLEDPDDGYERNLTPKMKGAAARLSAELAGHLGYRLWVTPVVVVWGRWSGQPHLHDGVAWVHGAALTERLLDHSGVANTRRHLQVVRALEALRARVGER